MKHRRKVVILWIVIPLFISFSCKRSTPEIVNVPEIEWIKTYSGSGSLVQQTSDGRYIIAGSKAYSGKGYDIFILKTDVNGDSLWAKNYGGRNSEHCTSIQQTSDEGYFIIGYTLGEEKNYSFYIKTDSLGDTLWTKKFEGSLYSSHQTLDGGYNIVSRKDNIDIFSKINTDSDVMWTKTYERKKGYLVTSIRQTSDSEIIIAGRFYGYTFLKKANVDGSTLWIKYYRSREGDRGINSVQQTSDNGYIIVEYTRSGREPYDVYLTKTDGDGDSIWTKTYDVAGFDIGYSVYQTSDGGYVIAGTGGSFGSRYFIIPKFLEYSILMFGVKYSVLSKIFKLIGIGIYTSFYLLKTDSNGRVLWLKKIEKINISDIQSCSLLPPGFWEGLSFQLTSDGGYVIAGFSERDIPAEKEKFYLIKLKPEK